MEKHIIQEMEIIYTPSKELYIENKVKTSSMAYELLKTFYNPNTINFQEECVVIYLNQANNVLGVQKLSKGGISSTIIDIRLILATALKSLARGIIISHNHPSNNLNPSESDKANTNRVKLACEYMELILLDHLIVTPLNGFFSFADAGLL